MDYIIPILFVVVLVSGAIYKLLTKDVTEKITEKMEDPLVGPIQRQSKKFHEDNFDMNLAHEAYKERKVIERRVNDHMAEIMNIKKKK